jgi:hypothetical protein
MLEQPQFVHIRLPLLLSMDVSYPPEGVRRTPQRYRGPLRERQMQRLLQDLLNLATATTLF